LKSFSLLLVFIGYSTTLYTRGEDKSITKNDMQIQKADFIRNFIFFIF